MGRSDGGLDLSGLSGGNVTLRGGIAPVRAYAEGLMADVLAGTLAPGPTHGIGGEANQTVDDAALVSTPEFSTAAAEATHRSPYTSGVGEPNAPSVDKDFSCNQAVQDTESHLNSSGPSRTDAILQRYSESGWGLDPAGDSRKLSDTSYCIDEYSCDVDYIS